MYEMDFSFLEAFLQTGFLTGDKHWLAHLSVWAQFKTDQNNIRKRK